MTGHVPNELIHSTSTYLKQHAYNPVRWVPWSAGAFERAAAEHKLVIVSIGYSACHWCHVMEKESFEDVEVAEVMNRSFICIKVDREERPDVDHTYMSAVQLMTGRGGWPLNCITLPDGKPVYGGTYFNKRQWLLVLNNLAENFEKDPDRFKTYGEELTAGIRKLEQVTPGNGDVQFSADEIRACVQQWKQHFDNTEGGPDRAPKFPMPVNYRFLLHFGFADRDAAVLEHVRLTAEKMALGGIYDQVGGGFARYSVDGIWKVPHFEKMLYDNAQLISLYAELYKAFADPLYARVIRETVAFVIRELQAEDGTFYCALDADSEGVEGKFYVWEEPVLKQHLASDYDLFADYFVVSPWEQHACILMVRQTDRSFAQKNRLSEHEAASLIASWKARLLKIREERVRPGLDEKRLTSWNALMLVGFVDAFEALQDASFLKSARMCYAALMEKAAENFPALNHTLAPATPVRGFLEDYALLIHAQIRLFQATGETDFLNQAREMTTHVLTHFDTEHKRFFRFASNSGEQLISEQVEVQDNVIPASNSVMALNLYFLGNYFSMAAWTERSSRMVTDMIPAIKSYPSGYANWLLLAQIHALPLSEVVVCGPQALRINTEIRKHLLNPGTISVAALSDQGLAATRERFRDPDTLVYCCTDHVCQLPVTDVAAALQLIGAGNRF